MGESLDSESLLKGFQIGYDPVLLARHRVMFAIQLRKYLAHYDCMHEEFAVGEDGEINRAHPRYGLIRSCVATAWAEIASEERRMKFAEQYGGSCGSGACSTGTAGAGASAACSPGACAPSACGEPTPVLRSTDGSGCGGA
ncbi:hypothetical protein [Paenibacillus mesotrionivorans]|uniref:Uncharacterized protein n=1 Tax=Paenibacillus mesotrionivorans TaxID=3160968 RepID=A0ACC7NSI2_9BACL